MLKREDIKNGTLVFDEHDNTFGIIDEVGNARQKGDRGNSSTPDDELSYTVVDILSGERQDGICECSHMTSNLLSVATKEDINIYLAKLEADALIELGKAKKEVAAINDAINKFSKIV